VRPGSAAGPPLVLVVPVGDPGHAGVRVPGGGRGHRACPPSGTVGADPVDLQRGPAPVRRCGLSARRRPWAPVALVVVASPPPSPRPGLPLPPASQRTMKVRTPVGELTSDRVPTCPRAEGEHNARGPTHARPDVRARRIHRRCSLRCGYESAQPGGRGRLLWQPVRLGVRGCDAAGIGAQVLRRPAPQPGRGGGRIDPSRRAADRRVEHVLLGR
jgi:hypothetical protein